MAYTGYVGPFTSLCFCGHSYLAHYQNSWSITQSIAGTGSGANITVTVSGGGLGAPVVMLVATGTTPTLTAVAIVAAINGNAALQGIIVASNSVGVVTYQTPFGGPQYGGLSVNIPNAASQTFTPNTATLVSSGCSVCSDHHQVGPENSRVVGMTPQNLSGQP